MELSQVRSGTFKVRSEIVLLLMHKLSLTEDEVIGELCTLVTSILSKPRDIVKVNCKGWNVQRNKVVLGSVPLYITVCVKPDWGCMSIKVSVVNFSHERYYDLQSTKNIASSYVSSKLEKMVGE